MPSRMPSRMPRQVHFPCRKLIYTYMRAAQGYKGYPPSRFAPRRDRPARRGKAHRTGSARGPGAPKIPEAHQTPQLLLRYTFFASSPSSALSSEGAIVESGVENP